MADVSKVKLNGTAYNVKDASVPSWAKQSSKPSYTQDEVGDGSTYKRVTSTEKSTWNNKGTYSKPSGGIPKSDLASAVQTSLGKADTALQSFTESDPTVPSWAKQSSKPSYTASEVGAIATSAKGAANGVASLDSAGKVPSSQLPSYVDDVLEYSAKSSFPSTGETGKIYVDTSTNKTYRWSGSAYVEISASLALGETSSTAYAGDKGKTAYSHATDSSRLTTAQSSGLYKIATTAQGHIASVTEVAKSDITNLGIPGSDTNTHRPIQVNGTQVLGDNTTPLNLKAGSNVSLSNSSGTVTIAATDTTYSAATQSANGLMSSTDKTKLDGIATGATANIGTVTQVKVGSTAYNPSSGVVSLPAYPTTLPASDVSSWAKASSKPSYTASEVGAAGLYHTHGSINHDGTLNTTPIGISNGDRMLITSAVDNNLICTGVEFDGSTATKALTKKGTWETFNNYSHPTTSGNKHIPSGGSSGQILRWSADGTAAWGSDNNTWTAMVGATSSANGSVGYVNATPPKDGYNTKYLRADGSWQVPPDTKYSSKSAASGGTDVSLCTTGEKYTWNNKGTYSKPSGGIPKSDLASAVQTSLGNADTAYSALSTVSKNLAKVEKSFTSTADVLSSTGCEYTTSSNKIYRITAWAEYSTTNPIAVAIVNSTNGAVFGYAEHPSGLTNARVTATALIIGAEVVEIKAKYASSNTCTVGMIVEELCGV